MHNMINLHDRRLSDNHKMETYLLLVDQDSSKPIYSNAKTVCTGNESMRQNLVQIKTTHCSKNHPHHNILTFFALWQLALHLPVILF
jgi:hypothetical protein